TIALAAHEIAVRIESMSFMLGIGFGTAAATLVGQGLGAELQDIAEKSVWRTAFFSMVVMTVIGMLFVLFPEALVSLFSPSVAVGEMAVLCIMVAAFEQPSIALTMTLTGGMRGAGDTVSPLILSFLGTFAFRIPLVYLFAIVFRLGIFGVWLGTITDWGLRGIISVVLFRRGRWKKIKIR
ncbi:MAG TPA: MATE family efflux transporter, partial [candidate division WOR-3 bacterium]|nr:MATE family efflux transporter [candidate division WOR-3 bacterium]